jgi:hypothetical protein
MEMALVESLQNHDSMNPDTDTNPHLLYPKIAKNFWLKIKKVNIRKKCFFKNSPKSLGRRLQLYYSDNIELFKI